MLKNMLTLSDRVAPEREHGNYFPDFKNMHIQVIDLTGGQRLFHKVISKADCFFTELSITQGYSVCITY